MASISDDKLKLTIYPGRQQDVTAGLYLDMDNDMRQLAQKTLLGFSPLRSSFLQIGRLNRVLELLQGILVEKLYSLRQVPDNLTQALTLKGANQSEIPCETFQDFEKQSCNPEVFLHRTRLKIRRTLRNLQELTKAFPDEPMLQEVEQMLRALPADLDAVKLEQETVALTQKPSFQHYLQAKERFLVDWVKAQEAEQGQIDTRPLSDSELGGTLKALQGQMSKIEEKPEVLRYKNYQFFRSFNATTHSQLNSITLDFWKDEKMRDYFLRFMTATRSAFAEHAPFFVFRFENSFTYLLCGFPDDQLLNALERNQEMVPVHAKILMRQANQSYRELRSEDDPESYHTCLKAAMYPFVHHLNRRVRMELPDEFLNFFRV